MTQPASSPAKSIILEVSGYLATQYNRRNELSFRGGFQVTGNYSLREFMLAPNGGNVTITDITEIACLVTDGDAISLAITKGSNTITIALTQIAILSDALTSLVITNNAVLGGPTVRVRIMYS